MTDYLETPGRTSLKGFVDANQGSVNAYIRQFDKATDATKNLQKKFVAAFKSKYPNRKRSSDIRLDIEEAWTATQVERAANIQTGRVSAALLKAGGRKAVNLLKKAAPNSDEATAHASIETNDAADNHNPRSIDDNVASSNNVEEENTEELLFVLKNGEFKIHCIILYS
ncbi:hypothetical protein RO3G_05493 [Rhizopus delemar RA 99-880]|uniref:Uncharacterized protein n=1 Tax=Rhizopus delemar (strain RA 99-880 / ATCC MYA-4621 / FGSC 9543 / NRRL 43880) TaxID=246409 RepID=I1BX58_RHIO9|nr:hypothetical protein RO3G_05493 [Rhizopus delemar RA 99-880]|eukprot:EIE80788.1 hypothetical protein RO3G_05493 [Rhizopus delemar RA 99-880]